ncbi:MAG: EAL domain-containing protein [Oscillospiraceae bacterium]|nr:EAL domain-containing protein [Oscillospiraceae bacterium]
MQIEYGELNFERIDAYFRCPRPEPLIERLTELIEGKSKSKGVVVKLYLEDFKEFNETFGFQFGEMFLQKIARYLISLKDADVYRTAGVEFIIIFDKLKYGAPILDEISKRFESGWSIEGLDCICSINLAAITHPGKSNSAKEMLEQLGYAISESAKLGPNRYCFFDEALQLKLYRRNSIAGFLSKAIDNGLMEMRYRPAYNVKEGRFTHADSYMYLLHPEFGRIMAGEFMPIAEETGQIYKISNYAIHKGCELISMLREKNIDFEKISIPISPVQLIQKRFVSDVETALNAAKIPVEKLAFDISENVMASSLASSHSCMNEIVDMGISIILNDFGAGYTGITNILNMPVSMVRLGRFTVWQINNDEKGAALAGGLVNIAKKLKLTVIAEGVETKKQVRLLTKYGCNYLQGFYFAPTLSVEELIGAMQRTDFEPK